MTTYAPVPRSVLPRLPIDPRIRARRVAVRRDEGRRRLRRVVGVLAVGGVIAGIIGIALSPFLDVDKVAVVGAGVGRADEVRAAAGIDRGDPALFVDTDSVQKAVAALPWVAHVRVERDLPGTVRISVTERVPVGWVGREGQPVSIVDRRGISIATAPAPPPDLPHLPDAAAVPTATSPLAAPIAARAAAALPARVRKIATRVVEADGQVTIVLAGVTELRLGDGQNLQAKVGTAVAVLKARGIGVPPYVDVRVANAPVTG